MNASTDINQTDDRPAAAERLVALVSSPEFQDELREVAEDEAALVSYMEELAAVPDDLRHATLSRWARSDLWHPVMMILTGWQGQLAREAFSALRHDLATDTPAKRWSDAPHALGRESIVRPLGLEGADFATYAAAPFRTITDDDDRAWIAGAIGFMPLLDAKRLLRWSHLDITDMILWDPRTGEGRLAGEDPATSHLILQAPQDERMTVFGHTGAYFRAWAGRRARLAALAQKAARGEWAHAVFEPVDGGLPGALVIGDVGKVRWSGVTAPHVIAGAGVTKNELRGAALRAAGLPRFTEDVDARG